MCTTREQMDQRSGNQQAKIVKKKGQTSEMNEL